MEAPTHVLCIRLSALGDVAMTIPVFRALAATYPKLSITVVSKKFFAPLIDEIPGASFLAADVKGAHKGVRGLITLASEAKSLQIDAVADLHNVLRSKVVSGTLQLQGIRVSRIEKGRAEKRAMLEANGKPIKPLTSMHQRYAEVFGNLGLPVDLNEVKLPKPKALTPELHELIGIHTKKCIGIAPFAAHRGKMYPEAQMEAVIATLSERDQYQLFLFGGGAAEEKKLKAWAERYSNTTNMAGRLLFSEELKLISNLDLMVSMDSGNGHLAALYGVPVLTLWGVTHPYLGFRPFGQPNAHQLVSNRKKYPRIPTSVYGNKVPRGYENVMESIAVELVVQKIAELA
ncbi:glycosyltransferase family 9 protein [Altibacter sp. HG106]|uniref:glycosyltransferase family 9 protein n=1 Tax=Altibacter sp. HG106 TaxID=3023937 RepID=UPI002350B5CB|nr:glycosyltransferase family 9 protein [Altibacter sp. HG106]MDC7995021.1 glycosyltransferase family 9 protein [Altibacter sp. HG106]